MQIKINLDIESLKKTMSDHITNKTRDELAREINKYVEKTKKTKLKKLIDDLIVEELNKQDFHKLIKEEVDEILSRFSIRNLHSLKRILKMKGHYFSKREQLNGENHFSIFEVAKKKDKRTIKDR